MHSYDLCLAWNWEYDEDFVNLFEMACISKDLTFLQATPKNIETLLSDSPLQNIALHYFWDRASEHDPRFKPLVDWITKQAIPWINDHEKTKHACDKAAMHYAFIHAGLHTPYTIILPPYTFQQQLKNLDLNPLGEKFAIKPAHGGGGEGVILNAKTRDDVHAARQAHPDDHYLLQAHIDPIELDARPAWFRVIYCTGKSYPCWWDPQTHIYAPVTTDEEINLGLSSLNAMVHKIAHLSGLDILSTEIALTASGTFIAIDYINDQIDLRLQSRAPDCVPDFIVQDIVDNLTEFILKKKNMLFYRG